ncbi:hypothetical protein EYZ11_007799 [Aspergillus tanneri]|uniref:Uncharacterized protein n=1 Tax=Aspergillus tanneri TaxID=1220188 RepID=A0A4S3JCD2_9EURO|nr:uncharacterized protein ATNIH1004_009630 [Aspergillus tanneri]KAA8642875.1 hypothetical protein ATNIH1004_009630 [Aspergillus tanneri]THC92722.1 hypothetical protein EYZ11_007799 [Aspergillus tanneri]
MKFSVSLSLYAISLLPSAYAWKFTWRDADGNQSVASGEGPHACIKVDHAKGQVFDMSGEGEKGINMLMFTTSDCSGRPSGMATQSFTKKASVDIKGFKVVKYDPKNPAGSDSDSDSDSSTASHAASSSAISTGTVTNSTASSSSVHGSKITDASKTSSSAAEASKTETKTGSASTGSDIPSATSSGANASSTGENSASSLSGGNTVNVVVVLALGLATLEWLV